MFWFSQLFLANVIFWVFRSGFMILFRVAKIFVTFLNSKLYKIDTSSDICCIWLHLWHLEASQVFFYFPLCKKTGILWKIDNSSANWGWKRALMLQFSCLFFIFSIVNKLKCMSWRLSCASEWGKVKQGSNALTAN